MTEETVPKRGRPFKNMDSSNLQESNESQSQAILARMERIEKLLQEKEDEIQVLKSMQDPTNLSLANSKINPDRRMRVRLTQLFGKLVVDRDKMPMNKVFINSDGRQVAQQIFHVYYQDGTEEDVELSLYNQGRSLTDWLPVNEVREKSEKGKYLVLELSDGQTVEVHENLVN